MQAGHNGTRKFGKLADIGARGERSKDGLSSLSSRRRSGAAQFRLVTLSDKDPSTPAWDRAMPCVFLVRGGGHMLVGVARAVVVPFPRLATGLGVAVALALAVAFISLTTSSCDTSIMRDAA